MKRHYCPVDKTELSYVGECNWCGEKEMIEPIGKPQGLDNDIAVVKILQLLGQLSVKDIKYVLDVASKIYGAVAKEDKNEAL